MCDYMLNARPLIDQFKEKKDKLLITILGNSYDM